MFDGSLVRARHILLIPASNDPKVIEQTRQQLLAVRKQIEDTAAAGLAKLPANTDNLAREKARARLIEETFAAQAKEKSACPSKKQGGDVDWFPRAGSMVEPFAKAAFALKPYQMSDVVQTQFGLHLILAIDQKAGKTAVKFEETKDDVKEIFAGRLREQLCEQLRAKAKINMK
jgi:parvulin-like peptidyl-prolyl isomerase